LVAEAASEYGRRNSISGAIIAPFTTAVRRLSIGGNEPPEVNLMASEDYQIKQTEVENALHRTTLAKYRAKKKIKLIMAMGARKPKATQTGPSLEWIGLAPAPAPKAEAAPEEPTFFKRLSNGAAGVVGTVTEAVSTVASSAATAAGNAVTTATDAVGIDLDNVLTIDACSLRRPPAVEETVEMDKIGYMALKRLVIAHGVPKKAAGNAPNKGMLKELAIKHGCTKLTFV